MKILVFFLFACSAYVTGVSWTKVNPKPTAAPLTSVAYGEGKYVVVGFDQGFLISLSSSDLVNWSLDPTDDELSSNVGTYIAYLENVGFVLTSGQSEAAFSKDGINWNYINTEFYFGDLVAANGLFVSSGLSDPTLAISSDGIHWDYNTQVADYITPNGITYAAGNFLFFGTSPYALIYSSEDARQWNLAFNLSAEFPDFEFSFIRDVTAGIGNDLWVAASLQRGDCVLYYSGDSNKWFEPQVFYEIISSIVVLGQIIYLSTFTDTQVNYVSTNYGLDFAVNEQVLGIVYEANNVLFSLGNFGLLQYSTNALNWTSHDEGVVGSIDTAFYSEKLTSFVINSGTDIYVSKDGENWNAISSFPVYSLRYSSDLGLFYGLTNNNLATSNDLVHWNVLGATNISAETVSYNAAAARFAITCIERWDTFYDRGYIYTSTDSTGSEFVVTFAETPDVPSSPIANLDSSKDLFVFSDYANIYTSKDGVTWETVYHFVQDAFGGCVVTHAVEKFFFLCDQLLVSDNGTNWENSLINVPVFGVNLVYWNGSATYLVYGEPGEFYSSPDGMHWTKETAINEFTSFAYVDSFGNGFPLIAVADDDTIYVSTGK